MWIKLPYVDIKVAGKLTEDQKNELAQKITKIITDVTGKPSQYVYVVFEEVERENWAIAGKLLKDKWRDCASS